MNEKPKDYYRVLAPGVPNYRDVSKRLSELTHRADVCHVEGYLYAHFVRA
jgi:hypothetical protein